MCGCRGLLEGKDVGDSVTVLALFPFVLEAGTRHVMSLESQFPSPYREQVWDK